MPSPRGSRPAEADETSQRRRRVRTHRRAHPLELSPGRSPTQIQACEPCTRTRAGPCPSTHTARGVPSREATSNRLACPSVTVVSLIGWSPALSPDDPARRRTPRRLGRTRRAARCQVQGVDQGGGVVGVQGVAHRGAAPTAATVAPAVVADVGVVLGEPARLVGPHLGVAAHAVHEHHRRPLPGAFVVQGGVVDVDGRHGSLPLVAGVLRGRDQRSGVSLTATFVRGSGAGTG